MRGKQDGVKKKEKKREQRIHAAGQLIQGLSGICFIGWHRVSELRSNSPWQHPRVTLPGRIAALLFGLFVCFDRWLYFNGTVFAATQLRHSFPIHGVATPFKLAPFPRVPRSSTAFWLFSPLVCFSVDCRRVPRLIETSRGRLLGSREQHWTDYMGLRESRGLWRKTIGAQFGPYIRERRSDAGAPQISCCSGSLDTGTTMKVWSVVHASHGIRFYLFIGLFRTSKRARYFSSNTANSNLYKEE